jgi:hypothetical protein
MKSLEVPPPPPEFGLDVLLPPPPPFFTSDFFREPEILFDKNIQSLKNTFL